MDKKKVFGQLEKIALGRMYSASFRAVLRLQVYFTGRTHELMLDFGTKAAGAITRAGGKEGVLDGVRAFGLQTDLLRMWGDTWMEWQAEFQQIRREAGRIPFGVMAVMHERIVRSQVEGGRLQVEGRRSKVEEGIASGEEQERPRNDMNESKVVDGVFDPQLRILLTVAEEYMYGDTINLSDRIWRIDREAREGINQVIINGISSQKSAWDVAQDLQQYLGAGQDCPRWTSSRLYGTSKKEIAQGNPRGLFSGNDCDGQGVSYKALRLARTEIQKIHALATDRMMAQQPWVEKEKINLSAAHPERDECDEVAEGGENGEGIYPVGENELPFHPNCLCYKTAVLTDQKTFTSNLNAWLKGERADPALDAYAAQLGLDVNTSLMPAAIHLAVWMFSDDLKDWLK